MNAIGLVVEQHRVIEELFEQLDHASSAARIDSIVSRITSALSVHLAVEEGVFYSAMRARRSDDNLRSQLEEHVAIKQLVADLAGRDSEDPSYSARVAVLEEQVRHHFDDEEVALLPRARQLFSDAELDGLGAKMADVVDELSRQGAATAPADLASPP